jgi:sporulation protein YlmC with PRC-barrel domain
MAPDRTVGKRGEDRFLTARVKGGPMKLIRLAFSQHPRPPQRELRQRGVFDSGGRLIGQVKNIYVDDDRSFQFVDVAISGLLGFGKKHHLVPVEAIVEDTGSITLTIDRQTVESAPKLAEPHAAPDEGIQRAAREHCEG